MNELTQIFGEFSLSDPNEFINYSYFDFFKNPNKLPINNVFLERHRHELDKGAINNWNVTGTKNQKQKCVTTKKEVIPALDGSWLPEYLPTFEYQEYDFSLSQEENTWFLENNRNYKIFLDYLIRSTYHQFWCSVLFRDEVQTSIRSFLLNPIPLYLYKELGDESKKVYKSVFNAFYMVLRKLCFFQQSETEYMPNSLGSKYLIERRLLNLPIVVTITLLYQEFDNELIDQLSEIYFTSEGQEKIIQKEVENLIKHSVVVFEMIKCRITGNFDPNLKIVPISLEERPKIFSLSWIDSVLNYLLNMILSLKSVFRLRKMAVKMALRSGVPEKLAQYYETIFNEVYDLLEDRPEIKEQKDLSNQIFYKLGLARTHFVDTFHHFATHLLDELISKQGDQKSQQDIIEMYVDTMTNALEYEIFVCDYDFKYSISQTVEMFEDFSQIDKTRVEYIITSLRNLERHDFIREKFRFDSTFSNHLPTVHEKEQQKIVNPVDNFNYNTQQENLENKIQTILGIFPHLGDGFVEKCLEHYDFDGDQVVQAILEENLPPHIVNMPFDLPRIPPEPEPPKPVLAYRGKKPGFDDALSMLNDRNEKSKMKTLVMDGIKYNSRYDFSDDEYDDRDDLLERDFVVEREVEKYEKPNEEDLVSDTSYSDNEYDEDGKPVETGDRNRAGFKPFCEDPAVVRARYEARFGARRGRGSGVVGKPRGQGQEKSVVNARQKKNVQKSSRANHNRKSGSQYKRNRGMVP